MEKLLNMAVSMCCYSGKQLDVSTAYDGYGEKPKLSNNGVEYFINVGRIFTVPQYQIH